ncbi:MAG: Mcm2-7 hexameric complex component [Watsoniomyces obsoletus]|nr:MAG: Mcm2-7 hexameric complex component [Watsoniomyces obsoletus]
MVSFSCESCNDVLPKKRLDAHIQSCWNASFTCLDCMQHFMGTEYRAHTSCISEAQKYQGALYRSDKERRSKNRSSRQDATDALSTVNAARRAYVEDAPDQDTGTVTIVDAPPHAPSPPRAPLPAAVDAITPTPAASGPTAGSGVNVFDFLVNDDTPNASRTAIASEDIMKDDDDQGEPPIITEISPRPLQTIVEYNASRETFGESGYAENGFHYGQGPVPASMSMTIERHPFMTPAAQQGPPPPSFPPSTDRVRVRPGERTKDRKRKRVQVEELHIPTTDGRTRFGGGEEDDEMMPDAPPPMLQHSGLTGGLNRLLRPMTTERGMSSNEYPPSPDYSSGGAGNVDSTSPGSPLKRSKRHSLIRNPMTALVPTRRRSTSQSQNEHPRDSQHHQKLHRQTSKRHSSRTHRTSTTDHPSSPPLRKLKTIKYRPEHHRHDENKNNTALVPTRPNQGNGNNNQSTELIVYRSRADLFMSFVNKGPESEKGCSINKALKRYHRERGTTNASTNVNGAGNGGFGLGLGMAMGGFMTGAGNGNGSGTGNGNGNVGNGRSEEEKELWKSLRLRRNDRGEIVLFAASPEDGT